MLPAGPLWAWHLLGVRRHPTGSFLLLLEPGIPSQGFRQHKLFCQFWKSTSRRVSRSWGPGVPGLILSRGLSRICFCLSQMGRHLHHSSLCFCVLVAAVPSVVRPPAARLP